MRKSRFTETAMARRQAEAGTAVTVTVGSWRGHGSRRPSPAHSLSLHALCAAAATNFPLSTARP